jgi:signal transduction histidine kinase
MASQAIARAADLTERARTQRQLLAASAQHGADAASGGSVWDVATREIARVTRERDRNMATLAHELRQPLAAAVAAERLLGTTAPDDVRQRARAVLARQLAQLSALVDALLDYSRLTLQAPRAPAVQVDVNALAADIVEAAAPLAAARGQTLECAVAPQPAFVLGDATRLRQAVSNLLHNALRYTPAGGRIDVAVGAGAGTITVDVRDTGEGFAPERIDEMFLPFVRLSPAGAGLGIGLPMVRRVVEMHGGAIRASSDGPGRGSVFTVTLPAAPQPRDAA